MKIKKVFIILGILAVAIVGYLSFNAMTESSMDLYAPASFNEEAENGEDITGESYGGNSVHLMYGAMPYDSEESDD